MSSPFDSPPPSPPPSLHASLWEALNREIEPEKHENKAPPSSSSSSSSGSSLDLDLLDFSHDPEQDEESEDLVELPEIVKRGVEGGLTERAAEEERLVMSGTPLAGVLSSLGLSHLVTPVPRSPPPEPEEPEIEDQDPEEKGEKTEERKEMEMLEEMFGSVLSLSLSEIIGPHRLVSPVVQELGPQPEWKEKAILVSALCLPLLPHLISSLSEGFVSTSFVSSFEWPMLAAGMSLVMMSGEERKKRRRAEEQKEKVVIEKTKEMFNMSNPSSSLISSISDIQALSLGIGAPSRSSFHLSGKLIRGTGPVSRIEMRVDERLIVLKELRLSLFHSLLSLSSFWSSLSSSLLCLLIALTRASSDSGSSGGWAKGEGGWREDQERDVLDRILRLHRSRYGDPLSDSLTISTLLSQQFNSSDSSRSSGSSGSEEKGFISIVKMRKMEGMVVRCRHWTALVLAALLSSLKDLSTAVDLSSKIKEKQTPERVRKTREKMWDLVIKAHDDLSSIISSFPKLPLPPSSFPEPPTLDPSIPHFKTSKISLLTTGLRETATMIAERLRAVEGMVETQPQEQIAASLRLIHRDLVFLLSDSSDLLLFLSPPPAPASSAVDQERNDESPEVLQRGKEEGEFEMGREGREEVGDEEFLKPSERSEREEVSLPSMETLSEFASFFMGNSRLVSSESFGSGEDFGDDDYDPDLDLPPLSSRFPQTKEDDQPFFPSSSSSMNSPPPQFEIGLPSARSQLLDELKNSLIH